MLALGKWSRTSGGIVFGLRLVFFSLMVRAFAQGKEINCGCFGNGGVEPNAIGRYPAEIARDAGLLLLSSWPVWRSRQAYAVATVQFPPRPAAPQHTECATSNHPT